MVLAHVDRIVLPELVTQSPRMAFALDQTGSLPGPRSGLSRIQHEYRCAGNGSGK